jgi:molecular chaperone DnaK
LSPHDVERVVFVGGPTHYKPLRDKVAFELGIAPSTDVNPMTAVAEGAAVFAESIDWASQSRGRKSARGASAPVARSTCHSTTSRARRSSKAKIVAKLGHALRRDRVPDRQPGHRVVIWPHRAEGRRKRRTQPDQARRQHLQGVRVRLQRRTRRLREDKIVIARTAASIDAIPASHSIGVEARDKVGGRLVLDYLVREGDQLPKKGKKSFKAGESLKAGSAGSIKFKLWEGDISDPINDNRFIGMFEIKGSDFDDGVIAAGAELICEYEVLDSGNISSGGFGAVHQRFVPERTQLLLQPGRQGRLHQSGQEHPGAVGAHLAAPRRDGIQGRRPASGTGAREAGTGGTIKSGEADPETAKQAMDQRPGSQAPAGADAQGAPEGHSPA